MSQGSWRLGHHDMDRGGSTAFGPVRVWPIARDKVSNLHIELAAGAPGAWDARQAQRWADLCGANPRLHDGPIWSVRAFDPTLGTVSIGADAYSRYAVRPSLGTGVAMLAVRGIITASNAHGRLHVLMGQRSIQTRIYGDMWEVIPGGGMPRLDSTELNPPSMSDLIEHLRVESREEAGLEVPQAACAIEAFCDDTYAGGFDVLIGVCLTDDLATIQRSMGERDWEHRQLQWLAVDEVANFDAAMAGKVSPPTRAIFRYRGWVSDKTQ
jgi:8-oxo-dGTP pyrophosphatase MutT (NUDIX family)